MGQLGDASNPVHALIAGNVLEREMYAVPNVGTVYIAAYAGGSGVINDSTGPWAIPRPYRTVQLALTSAGTVGTVTITGTDPTGAAQTEVLTSVAGSTVQGAKCWKTITSVVSSTDPGSSKNLTLSWGRGWALRTPYDSTAGAGLSCAGVVEALAAGSNAATGVVIPTTAPDGSKVFCVDYKKALTLA